MNFVVKLLIACVPLEMHVPNNSENYVDSLQSSVKRNKGFQTGVVLSANSEKTAYHLLVHCAVGRESDGCSLSLFRTLWVCWA